MEQITNEERFKKIMKIANDMAATVTNDLAGVAMVTLSYSQMFTELATICKNQEKLIRELTQDSADHGRSIDHIEKILKIDKV